MKAALSSEHANVEPASFEMNSNVEPEGPTMATGPVVIVVSGGVVSGVWARWSST